MPWKETTTVSLRSDFVHLASQEGANMTQLCRQFGISRRIGYKWLHRFACEGPEGLQDHSRRPHHSPARTPEAVEAHVVEVRVAHPAWGGRKIRAWLQRAGYEPVPPASTITEILRRHGLLDPIEAVKHRPYRSFEMSRPNELWQMDFKGYFALPTGGYCHPLTVLDDHSRFLVGLQACPDETAATVQQALTAMFRTYGLPERMLMDNGSPWGDDADTRHTALTAWLLRLGIRTSHGRPYHPQTQGKDERLHRTLQAEVLREAALETLSQCQACFDVWRPIYNEQRPHEALGLQPPVSRYAPSPRIFPDPLPPVVYGAGETLRKVDATGKISYRNRAWRIGRAFRGFPVAIRPGAEDGRFDVYFCSECVAQLDLREPAW